MSRFIFCRTCGNDVNILILLGSVEFLVIDNICMTQVISSSTSACVSCSYMTKLDGRGQSWTYISYLMQITCDIRA